jgi:hypothetical protein
MVDNDETLAPTAWAQCGDTVITGALGAVTTVVIVPFDFLGI